VLLSEDYWLSRLYKDELQSVADYVRCSSRLRDAMGGHVETLLKAGLSVVLDFPANTPANRRWMRSLFENAGADHRLHFLDVPDEVCKARLQQRNAGGTHDFVVNDAEFEAITRFFVPPSEQEDFETTVYRETEA
jgi:predicted kinase